MNIDLYDRIPEIYRELDEDQGWPLKALVSLLQDEYDTLHANIEDLYDNWFIETCDPWLVPYIAGLLDVRGVDGGQNDVVSQRSRVGNTLRYRRRKGIPGILQREVQDAAGWSARVVQAFERLSFEQSVDDPRPGRGGFVSIRTATDKDFEGCFDAGYHTIDVRPIQRSSAAPRSLRRGVYNIGELALFIARMRTFSMPFRQGHKARAGAAWLDGLGRDGAVFHVPRTPRSLTRPNSEIDLPIAIPPEALRQDLAAHRQAMRALPRQAWPTNSQWYGPARGLQLFVGPSHSLEAVPPWAVQVVEATGTTAYPDDWRRPAPGIMARYGLEVETADAFSGAMLVWLGKTDAEVAIVAEPDDLPSTAERLQRALREAFPQKGQGILVRAAHRRIVVVGASRRVEDIPTFLPTASDPLTATRLGLYGAGVRCVLLSEPTSTAPLATTPASLGVNRGARQWVLDLPEIDPDAPDLLAERASQLECALQNSGDPILADGLVFAADAGRLLVVPGASAVDAWEFTESVSDPTSVYELGLDTRVGLDVTRGRVVLSLSDRRAKGGSYFADYAVGRRVRIGAVPGQAPRATQPDETVFRADIGRAVPGDKSVPVSVQDAVDAWNKSGRSTGELRIVDSRCYEEVVRVSLKPTQGHQVRHLRLRAALGTVPTIRSVQLVEGGEGASVTLDGLAIRGAVLLCADIEATLRHCTVSGALMSPAGNAPATVAALSCVLGPVRLPQSTGELSVTDSIVDPLGTALAIGPIADEPDSYAPTTTLVRTTVLGRARIAELSAEYSLFQGALELQRRLRGYAQWCYFSPGSTRPSDARQCEPPGDSPWRPRFVSLDPGSAAYGVLSDRNPDVLLAGAHAGEIGAYRSAHTPQREAFARDAIRDFLPISLTAGLFFVN